MPELPKIVRSRLRKMTPETSVEHPDANLLAAFAEHTLLERERAAVTNHLALCADCREYLALAFAIQEPEAVANAGRATPAPTLHWVQAWRWVAPAAVACCIVAVSLQYRVRPPNPEKSKEPAATVASSRNPAPAPENLETQLPRQAPIAKLKVENHNLKTSEPLVASRKMGAAREHSLPDLLPGAYSATKDAAAATSPPVKESPPSTTLAAGQENTPVKLVPQLGLEASAVRNNSMETVPAPAASALVARPRVAESAKTRLTFEQSRITAVAPEKSQVEPGVLWSINASPGTSGNSFGAVERSLDRGKTWEAVRVKDGVSFRAVAAAGLHVWAGGSGGALFHSSDGGLHWVQVAVASAYTPLTGTIVSIHAENPGSIRITTTSGEKWSSSDGGRQWARE
jgi:hypothetical protein